MRQTNTPSPMLAKPSSASGTALSADTVNILPFSDTQTFSADTDPETVFEDIRGLITDHLLAARRLAAEASARFPDHSGIRNTDRILNQGRSRVTTGGPEPSRDEEIEWLHHPPDSVRGQWVALVGTKLVDSAETLAELVELLRSKNLEKKALVHRIDA